MESEIFSRSLPEVTQQNHHYITYSLRDILESAMKCPKFTNLKSILAQSGQLIL